MRKMPWDILMLVYSVQIMYTVCRALSTAEQDLFLLCMYCSTPSTQQLMGA